MKQIQTINLSRILPLTVVLLLLGAVTVRSMESARPSAVGTTSSAHRVQQQTAADTISGTYAGSVHVDSPAALGTLDLVIDITSSDNSAIAGRVNAVRTQVFLGGPSISGSVTASDGVTPTVRVESERFDGVVSGRTIQRHFVLTGRVLDGADTLQGQYVETITGFTPEPLQITGTFLLVRPNGSAQIVADPVINTPPPSPTPIPPVPGGGNPGEPSGPATPTPPVPGGGNNGGPGQGSDIFLPLVSNGQASVRAADGVGKVSERRLQSQAEVADLGFPIYLPIIE